ncbi:MAG: hypothetical protein ACRC3K_06210, partial [Plesiomonas sp.]
RCAYIKLSKGQKEDLCLSLGMKVETFTNGYMCCSKPRIPRRPLMNKIITYFKELPEIEVYTHFYRLNDIN